MKLAIARLTDIAREYANLARFGRGAPRPAERLWIDPQQVSKATAWFPSKSGAVRYTWPPAELMPFEDHIHVRFALAHWRDGLPWENTGVYEYMMGRIRARGRQDDCQTFANVVARFERLDELYESVKADGRMKTRQELSPAIFRETGGILVHFGPNSEPVIGDAGKHRLTIAKLTGVSRIPVQLGEIHIHALGSLPLLRTPAA